jgi:hypothetical protein
MAKLHLLWYGSNLPSLAIRSDSDSAMTKAYRQCYNLRDG